MATDVADGQRPPEVAQAASALLEAELQAAHASDTGRLPPERELALRLGVSRSAVRRWLDQLERDGTITRHVGRGTFVQPFRAGDDTTPAEIMAVRLLLEPQVLALAVANATVADIDLMRSCLTECETATTYEDFEQWDSRLHAAIAESTHNSLLIRLFSLVNEARNHPLWGTAKRRSFTEQRRHEYEHDHRDLVTAIDERDPAQAAAVMRRHLLRIRTVLLGSDA